MPVWLARMMWRVRGKRLVRLHFRPVTGSEHSIEGILLGRFAGHYLLAAAHQILDAESSVPLDGVVEVPAETVLFLQAL